MLNKTMKFYMFLLLCFASFSIIAGDNTTLSYYVENDKNIDIDCFYFRSKKSIKVIPTSETKFEDNKLQRSFQVVFDNDLYSVKNTTANVYIGEDSKEKARYNVVIDSQAYSGVIDSNFKKGFYLESKNNSFDQLYQTSSFYCDVHFANPKAYVIDESTLR